MKHGIRHWGPGLLMILPSIGLVGLFVYGLIGWNISISLSDEHGSIPVDTSGIDNYTSLLQEQRFQDSLENLATFTIVFLVGTLFFGLMWALLLERGLRGEGFFRSMYLFPMAVSFIASGVVWRWLLNASEGDDATGLNRLFSTIGLSGLENPWYSDPGWGMAAMAMPAVWQLSGYVMALFLAGLRSIPDELREAARIDGASEFRLYRHVIFPQLSPAALSALVIIGHMSLKVFDLIMAISGEARITEVPAVYLWGMTTIGDDAKAATIATILLLVVAVVVIPYLIFTSRWERR
ncbi:MAG: ABC transporter permease subunit [Propionibacteriales bacterium]|nr:ABC transporter permease subunit [Propionibacteriales bacterium]